jgi:hypothetical protein
VTESDRLRSAAKAVLASSGEDHWALVELDDALYEAEHPDPYEPKCCLCGRYHYGGCG